MEEYFFASIFVTIIDISIIYFFIFDPFFRFTEAPQNETNMNDINTHWQSLDRR